MTALEELQNKSRGERTPLEQCIVDAATFEEAEHDGETELMESAAVSISSARGALAKAKSVFKAGRTYGDLRMAEKYIEAALDALK